MAGSYGSHNRVERYILPAFAQFCLCNDKDGVVEAILEFHHRRCEIKQRGIRVWPYKEGQIVFRITVVHVSGLFQTVLMGNPHNLFCVFSGELKAYLTLRLVHSVHREVVFFSHYMASGVRYGGAALGERSGLGKFGVQVPADDIGDVDDVAEGAAERADRNAVFAREGGEPGDESVVVGGGDVHVGVLG
uniref:Uncharacterized protein n=1 Tax=Ralstonia solanacearum TaxID=305 RepID=A0A0S4X3X1_RALSL|nr:protein of unknown function [Ralstonia solanacearum]CUV58414.1 protein of unknown function [Ralstonia solanacearum]